jgi:hypothetical protein
MLLVLDLEAWSVDERRALIDLVRAKGGRSERPYISQVAAHARLHTALAARFAV